MTDIVNITKLVGTQIRDIRKSKGVTQKELGERLGISEVAVNRYEAGNQNLTLRTIQKIVDVLEVKLFITIVPGPGSK
ncbi:helix-turn-helix domain-containing protein [uncultured Fibrella sp.]|uniref:helix-turn-helix domain-containing protein n=1 Tax=uncultured Fibrella sp. TaxID=1284596 RepID=UPI0035CB9952